MGEVVQKHHPQACTAQHHTKCPQQAIVCVTGNMQTPAAQQVSSNQMHIDLRYVIQQRLQLHLQNKRLQNKRLQFKSKCTQQVIVCMTGNMQMPAAQLLLLQMFACSVVLRF
jgi:hypothetical protein